MQAGRYLFAFLPVGVNYIGESHQNENHSRHRLELENGKRRKRLD